MHCIAFAERKSPKVESSYLFLEGRQIEATFEIEIMETKQTRKNIHKGPRKMVSKNNILLILIGQSRFPDSCIAFLDFG